MDTQKKKRISKVREMKNDLILDAALKVFSQKGFHECRLEDIAVQAGFSKASLYNYYKDKEEIFLNVAIRQNHRMIRQVVSSDSLFELKEELSIVENMRRLLTMVFTTFESHFSFIFALDEFAVFNLFSQKSSLADQRQIQEHYLAIKNRLSEIVTHVIENARKKGEIGCSLDTDQLNTIINALIMGTIKNWKENRRMGNIEQTVEDLIQFLCHGFNIDAPCK
ncbi:MAG: TetR/AcrR family transcriptional regulator [Fibrobacterota bacterium]